MRRLIAFALLALLSQRPTAVFAETFEIQNAFPNLPAFYWPVDLQAPFDGSNRLFIVEKDGRIWVIQNDPSVSTRTLFLDISAKVKTDGSEGLLALAFHPDYENNGTFFVMYNTINPYTSRWARFHVSGNPNVADPLSEDPFIEIPQQNNCHKGCGLVFGADGYLYISVGDDCQGWPGQDRTTLMGKLLRIDVNGTSPGLDYAIPPDNPFAGNTQGWREEIYAYGLRNPWRFSIDRGESNRIFLGDVGEAAWEEIDIISKGRNYGWIKMEGTDCWPNPAVCDTVGMNAVMPIYQYPNLSDLGASVIGGYVYRGHQNPNLWGKYVYADVAQGIFTLDYNGVGWISELIHTDDPTKQFVSFGIDEENELYAVSLFGQIYKIVDTATTGVRGPVPAASMLTVEPNPFQTSTTLRFTPSSSRDVRVDVYDVRGHRVNTLLAGSPSADHALRWDGVDDRGRKLPSGVYFARLTINGRVATSQRIVLVR